jgi:DUF917 family protein
MKIDLEHVDDLARGAAILGTGGGGDPYIGSLMLKQAIEDHGPVDLIDVEALDDDDFVVPFAMMGAPTVLIEKLPNGDEMLAALRTIERYRNRRAGAILCAEIGGINALLPLVLGARCGLPVVDGDGMGRAFPQLQMVTYHIFGVPLGPMAMTDEYCNTVLFECADANDVERLSRTLVAAMGGSSSNCLYTMEGRDAKRSMVRNTISLALELGRTVRQARTGGDPFQAVLSYLRGTPYYQHCRVLFEGKTADLLRETKHGWALGRVVIEGLGSCVGRHLEIQFQNEHLVALEGERVRAIVPDLIAVLDAASAEPITTEGLKYGQRVKVLGISAAPIMRSAAALRVFGPQAFRLNAPFTPVETLNPLPTSGPTRG